ncbi:hypothetical protein MS6207_00258 [Escherichia coli]|nr:hypothetical protein [Escherichia coli]
MDFSLDFSGLADIARDLETLSRAENNKVLRDATRAGAEVMRDAVVERAPERTGKLKKNVVVLTQRSKRRGEIISGGGYGLQPCVDFLRGLSPRN